MKTKIKTKILIAVLVLLLAMCVIVASMSFVTTAKAEVTSGEEVSGEVITQLPQEQKSNWFAENWQAIVEIITSGGALTVIFAIIRLFGKIGKLRTDLGSANVDNKAIKDGFNAMVDEVEAVKNDLIELHKASEILKSKVVTSAEKSEAVLVIFEKLINASDLPSETKQSMQAVINKAISEVQDNDEA